MMTTTQRLHFYTQHFFFLFHKSENDRENPLLEKYINYEKKKTKKKNVKQNKRNVALKELMATTTQRTIQLH